jgi:hypothetical protein
MTREYVKWLKANKHNLGDADRHRPPRAGGNRRLLASLRARMTRSRFWPPSVSLLTQMQDKTHYLARELIARAMDWGDRDKLWPRVADPEPGPDICAVCGVARSEHPRASPSDDANAAAPCRWFHNADSYPNTEKTPFGRACRKCSTRHVPGDCPVRCCERDTNGDGNCDRHSAPGVLR